MCFCVVDELPKPLPPATHCKQCNLSSLRLNGKDNKKVCGELVGLIVNVHLSVCVFVMSLVPTVFSV